MCKVWDDVEEYIRVQLHRMLNYPEDNHTDGPYMLVL